MSSPTHPLPEDSLPCAETPEATLKAPRDAALEAANQKTADKKVLLDFFLSSEVWSLADPYNPVAGGRGVPVSLLHAILRVFLGAYGLDWRIFLRGGILGKTIADAIKLRLAKGDKPFLQEPLTTSDANVPGQNKPKFSKQKSKKKDDKDEEKKRDNVFIVNDQKYRTGIILNPSNISGHGDAAVFSLPFTSASDSSASVPLKTILKQLKIVDLGKLSFNVAEKTREPEASCTGSTTNPVSQPGSGSPMSSLEGLQPFIGEYEGDDVHEIYIQPIAGTELEYGIQRDGPGPDCTKSLVITGSFEGNICDEVISTGEKSIHITRQYSQLQKSSFPAAPWKLCIPLSSDLDLTCKGGKRLASGTHVFTIKKKKKEPIVPVQTFEKWTF